MVPGVSRGRLLTWESTPAGQRIAACMIVRDEEAVLGRALASVTPWVDELVVLDTGSGDATVAVAEACGARVGHFAWCDSFAAARNAALGMVTAEWVLVVDADEELDPATAPRLRDVVRAGAMVDGPSCFTLPVVNILADAGAPATAPTVHRGGRVFRRLPGVHWIGEVHETVAVDGPATMAYVDVEAPTILHHGYASGSDARRRKAARNLELLERAHARDAAGGYYSFKLAQNAIAERRDEDAMALLRRAVAEAAGARTPARFIVAATELLARALFDAARAMAPGAGGRAVIDEAEVAIVRAIAHYPTENGLWLRLAEAAVHRGDDAAAARTYSSILVRHPTNAEALVGYASAMRHDAAVVLRTLDRHMAAHGATDAVCAWRGELLRTTGQVQEAYDFLDATTRAHRGFAECRLTLANLLESVGESSEAVHVLSPLLDDGDAPAAVYEVLGRALARLGNHEAARDAMTMAAARQAGTPAGAGARN